MAVHKAQADIGRNKIIKKRGYHLENPESRYASKKPSSLCKSPEH